MGGINKAALQYKGEAFSQIIAAELEKTGMPCYLSLAAYDHEVPEGWNAVSDSIFDPGGNGAGPMGGICSCLQIAKQDDLEGLYSVPCDAPFFSIREIRLLEENLDEETDAVCWRTSDGRIQTAFGWYSVRCADVFSRDIKEGKLKLIRSLEQLRFRVVNTNDHGLDDLIFTNINTAEDYRSINIETTHKQKNTVKGSEAL